MGHLQGKDDCVGWWQQQVGTPKPNDRCHWALTPFLPPGTTLLHSQAGRPVTLSLVCRDLSLKVRGSSWGARRLRAFPLPLATSSPEGKVPSPRLRGFPPGRARKRFLPFQEAQPLKILFPFANSPPPQVQSAIHQGAGLEISVSPHQPLPLKEGEAVFGGGGGEVVQVSTAGLVLLSRLEFQAWLGTSYSGHWPKSSSGVLPE